MSAVDPHLFVIFGATGDLTRRKLLPSLYRIITENGVGSRHTLLGVSRSELGDDGFRKMAREALAAEEGDQQLLEAWCDERVFYHGRSGTTAALDDLRKRIEEIEEVRGLPGNRIFYLALPPAAFPTVISALGESGLSRGPGWTRLVIEKPFGRDLESAMALNTLVHRFFDESQVYRIDHYLGKETVQNLLTFRFANLLFESSWNRDRVESVEITVAETLGTEGRAGYYDSAGVLRDMVQNHLTQLLALIAIDAPNDFTAGAIRSEKVQLLRSVGEIDPERVVLGQYRGGTVDGVMVPGYGEDPEVAAGSDTPTYAALRLYVNNWRWQGVPFYLRTGKRLQQRSTHIAVTFKRPPVCLFHGVADECMAHQNVLLLVLQPDEGFELWFDVKAPGEAPHVERRPLHFGYEEAYDVIPDAYQTLLLDVMEGDQTLFVRSDEVEASWGLYAPLLEHDIEVHPYPAGTWGPQQTDRILDKPSSWAARLS